MRRPRVRAYYPIVSSYSQISRCIIDIGENFPSRQLDFEFVSLGFEGPRCSFKQTTLPAVAVRVGCRLFVSGSGPVPKPLGWMLEALYLATSRKGDVAYVWPGTTLSLYRRLRDRGIPIAKEMINCEERFRRTILADAYARRGLRAPEELNGDQSLAEQDAIFALSNVIFAPSPLVERSLVEAGVPRSKIVLTRFGWDPRTFSAPRQADGTRPRAPVFLCIAKHSVRKGTLDLLEAWTRKRVTATLILVGPVEPEIAAIAADLIRRDDIQLYPHSVDLAPFYGRADVYIMPSYEEGSPIVVYFALAAGLAVIGTPASTSGLVEHGEHGLVCGAGDVDGLALSIDRMAMDIEFRRRAQSAARQRGLEVTWAGAAADRAAALERLAAQAHQSS